MLKVAEVLYKLPIVMIVLCVAAVLLCDLSLWVDGELTISQWVKANPEWFYWPAAVILLFLLWFWLHLFVLPPWLGGA